MTGELAGRVLALAASGQAPDLAWLDGGSASRSLVGAWPDRIVESDDLAALAEIQEAWRAEPEHVWIGWLTYDSGVDALLGRAAAGRALPGVVFRRYAGALEWSGTQPAVGHGDVRAIARLRTALETVPPRRPGEWPLGALQAELDPNEYRARVGRARDHIAAGDTYQVNLSQRFHAPRLQPHARSRREDASDLYAALRTKAPAEMGALISAGTVTLLSNSPETLLDVRWSDDVGDARARSWPIKGTRPRGADPVADAASRAELLASEKERAEHVMIVDLVRNDLGQLARAGSVEAPTEPVVVSLPTVHHLVSEVSCTLRPDWTLLALARAMFPGGSVTGAPKRRTAQIIDDLEDVPRGVYCGAIVVLEPRGTRWSIPIRTGVLDAAGMWLHAGGGIVADSDPEAERVETVVKTRAFAARLTPAGDV